MVAEITDLDVVETRKLASFRIVDAIEPIPDADAIELAIVGGWKVVTKKGEFNVGDPAVYFEIDSFLPEGEPAWQFLIDKSPKMMGGVKGHRLRTIKLRGQISQGLILPARLLHTTAYVLAQDPVSVLTLRSLLTPEQLEEADNIRYGLYEHEAGLSPQDMNLNKLLGITKWDPPLPAQLAGMAEGLFPGWIRKTDQERAQNLMAEIFGYEETVIPANAELNRPEIIRPAKADRDARYEISMKLDGSSATYGLRDQELVVCSRNLQLKICEGNEGNSFIRMLIDGGLDVALKAIGRNVAVQGELMGPNIQKNREELKDFKFFVFDIQDLDEGRNMTPQERVRFVKDLYDAGANFNKVFHVPVLHFDVTLQELGLTTMDKLLAFAEGPSLKHVYREGLVYKRMDGTFSFKTISNSYLAKEKD